MKLLLDTNLLLRISDRSHPHHAEATDAIAILRRRGAELRTVPQNMYEYWVVATRPTDRNGLGLSPEETFERLQRLKVYFPLLRDERAILERWQQLVRDARVIGPKAHDTRLVAAMERHGVTHLLTFNATDFKRFDHIQVLTPGDVIAA